MNVVIGATTAGIRGLRVGGRRHQQARERAKSQVSHRRSLPALTVRLGTFSRALSHHEHQHRDHALIAIHSTANRTFDASGKTTILTVPWMTKWSSAGAQIVPPPIS